MKTAVTRLLALGLALAASSVGVFACAGSETDIEPPDPVEPGTDAALPPVAKDAGAEPPEASADAGPRVCSDHGFCHTAIPEDQTLRGVWGDGSGNVWAVSAEGDVLRWDGNAWDVHASSLGPLYAVWGSSATDVWLGGETGLYHGTGSSSESLVFSPVTLEQEARIRSIWGSSAADIWAVGTTDEGSGVVLRFTGGPDPSWTEDPASTNGVAYSHVWGSSATGTWIAGTRLAPDDWLDEVVVLLKRPGSDEFEELELPSDPDWGPGLGDLAELQAAATSGTTTLLLGRTGTEQPGAWRGVSSDDGRTLTWSFALHGVFEEPAYHAAYGAAPSEIWAVGDYGRVRRFDGTSFSTVAITPGKLPVIDSLYAVWSSGPSEVWLVGAGLALRYDPSKRKDGTK